MFFWKKQRKEKDANQKLDLQEKVKKEAVQKMKLHQEKMAQQIQQQIQSEIQKAADEQKEQLAEILKMQQQMQKSLRKSMESVEDLADTIEDAVSQKEETIDSSSELALCNVLNIYMEQLWLLEDTLSEDDEWKKQFAIMKQKRQAIERLAAVQQTGNPGEQFDYRFHEILQTEDTTKEAKEGVIAKMYAPGLVYHGEVMKKAKVCVYRRMKDEQNNRN